MNGPVAVNTYLGLLCYSLIYCRRLPVDVIR
jgi:hypothetical protein